MVHNGVDTTKFKPRDKGACRKKLGLDPERLIIAMFASFKKQKNHPLLFQAMAEVVKSYPQLQLLLVGETLEKGFGGTNEYKEKILAVLKSLHLESHIKFLGKRDDVEEIYSACDFTVLPSLHEGTPNVVLESMACGVPVIVTDVSDNAIIVDQDIDGFVVPSGDEPALREKILTLCARRWPVMQENQLKIVFQLIV